MSDYKERYGEWAGNPNGIKPDLARCAKEVFSGYFSMQCSRRKSVGNFCKQHAPKQDNT